ncbi:MAG: glycoside hydrolase family 99-like domain-containing protein [Bacteroidales bacterium]|nr:glycoside hydrolase family 99-like domain-containing protein [Bacteroidales bacterium]
MENIIQASEKKIIFIKSWNEWAEGNYLEPDLQWGARYLEVIKDVLKKYNQLLLKCISSLSPLLANNAIDFQNSILQVLNNQTDYTIKAFEICKKQYSLDANLISIDKIIKSLLEDRYFLSFSQ